MAELTVIISYYKALENLKILFKALNNQSSRAFEVLLSEDDNNEETALFLKHKADQYSFTINHIHQKVDNGFRKNSMLNRAISIANTSKLAFIDSDCIPHKHFVKQYILNIDKESFCVGRAVFLDQKKTEVLKKSLALQSLSFWKLLGSKSTKIKDGIYSPYLPITTKLKGLVGRNWGCTKEALLAINGFDEDYVHAGVGEDVDVEWRLLENGLKRKSVKNKAIVYHLHHKRWYITAEERANYEMMQQKIKEGHFKCRNGIVKL
jgi:GT2 family glycosyltransferase